MLKFNLLFVLFEFEAFWMMTFLVDVFVLKLKFEDYRILINYSKDEIGK